MYFHWCIDEKQMELQWYMGNLVLKLRSKTGFIDNPSFKLKLHSCWKGTTPESFIFQKWDLKEIYTQGLRTGAGVGGKQATWQIQKTKVVPPMRWIHNQAVGISLFYWWTISHLFLPKNKCVSKNYSQYPLQSLILLDTSLITFSCTNSTVHLDYL